ncbi:hypothetical protein [Ferrimonas balearica]|uniref:hypothetical protein n=1 Tax=Ferrimonas balearica TaxID=44012 RepID=UPI001C9993D0|nr:hypothetical protein [Ferrimonas balearica]MBY5992050.1 hypothetical protein [Ferrimonas balearica]
MTLLVCYLLVLGAFSWAFVKTRAVAQVRGVIHVTRQASLGLMDKSLSDERKEHLARQSALRLLRDGAVMGGKLLLCLAAALLPLLLAETLGLVSYPAFYDFSLRLDVLLATLVGVIGLAWWLGRRRTQPVRP